MKFAIITHVNHKYQDNDIYAYEPYVREMNLWGKYVDTCKIVAPISSESISPIESKYNFISISLEKIPSFNLLNFKNKFKTIYKIPIICIKIFQVMFWADHIHIRCPGNIGMLGCIIQILFPLKKKTVKYAGNWDPKSKQPLSYRIQKWVVSNTILTHNCNVLVYGKWKNQSKNIFPFFTATYSENEIIEPLNKKIENTINVVFVGAFTKSKQPFLSVYAVEKLVNEGYKISLNMYGDGEEYKEISKYIEVKNLANVVTLHGNQSKEIIKKAFINSHFLIFISKSEGWPKVVAEAMFWKCIPISSNVSCIPYMLDYGKRGAIVDNNVDDIIDSIKRYISNKELYASTSALAMNWSQEYTLDLFSKKIKKLIVP